MACNRQTWGIMGLSILLFLLSFVGNYWNILTLIILAGAIWMMVVVTNGNDSTGSSRSGSFRSAIKSSQMVWITSAIMLAINIILFIFSLSGNGLIVRRQINDNGQVQNTGFYMAFIAVMIVIIIILISLIIVGKSAETCFRKEVARFPTSGSTIEMTTQ